MTRILERSGRFYPQRKHWLFGWVDYTETAVCDDGLQLNETIWMPTLEIAQKFFMPEKTTIHPATPDRCSNRGAKRPAVNNPKI